VIEPAPELVELLREYYRASSRGDTQFLAGLIDRAPGTLVAGTAPDEWWAGGDHIVATWSAAWQTRGGLPVVRCDPAAFRAGDVGWVADRAVWRLPGGQEVPFRLTAVFHRALDRWTMVQAHFSVGVPDDELVESSGDL
jgi:hypothetical protein